MRKEIPKEETFNKYGRAARRIEIAAFNEYGAIEEINESEMEKGHKLLRGRFVYTIKEKELKVGEPKTGAHVSDTRRLDARLRVRGFEEEQVESVSAPTINNNTARAASSIVPLKKWEFWVIDISRAYLQSKDSTWACR